MDLEVKDVADLLNVPEDTILRWLAEGKIPAYRMKTQYRFSKIEIEDWVMSSKLGQIKDADARTVCKEAASEAAQGNKQFSLFRALHKGGVFSDVPGDTKEEVITACCKLIAKKFDWDADVVTDLLLDREKLMPTALNNGIGVPHARDFLLNKHFDAVVAAFPRKPIQYGALDGKPVHTLFFLFACEDKRHLHLLAKIAHLSSQPGAIQFLSQPPSQDDLLTYVKDWESRAK